MITKELQLLKNNEEQVPYLSPYFLYYAGVDEISKYYGKSVPWHWHRSFEFSWVHQGRLKVKTNLSEVILSAGEGCFVNSNFLHYYEAMPGTDCIYFCQVFDPSILSGAPDSVFDRSYVQPILRASNLDLFVLRPVTSRQRQVLELLKLTQDLAEHSDFGFEMQIRNYLSEIWILLFQEAEKIISVPREINTANGTRMKIMMSYIQTHFSEKISLEDIANTANISTRECLRCFQNSLEKTPFHYLMEYRVQKAAELLAESNRSITEISEMCGFSSVSYFSKIFKRIMDATPGEFRKKYRKRQIIS